MGKIDIIVIGNQGSGKTSLISRYKNMNDGDPTVGAKIPDKGPGSGDGSGGGGGGGDGGGEDVQQQKLGTTMGTDNGTADAPHPDDGFSYAYQPTIGIELVAKKAVINGLQYKICIWDTAGQEQYFALTKSYFQKADGVVIVFDITDEESYKRISEYWIEQVKEKSDEKVKKILIGNKVDLLGERKVKFVDAKKLAHHFGMEYFETSARSGEQVKESFDYLAKMCVNSLESDDGDNSVTLRQSEIPKRATCVERFKDIFKQLLR